MVYIHFIHQNYLSYNLKKTILDIIDIKVFCRQRGAFITQYGFVCMNLSTLIHSIQIINTISGIRDLLGGMACS